MSRRALTSVFTAAALALAVPAFAQSGARPNPSGSSSGSAVSRPSGGGGGGSSSGGGSMSSPSSGGGSSVSRPSPSGARPRADRAASAPERRTGSAVSRGSSSSGDTRRVTPGGAARPSDDNGDRRRAVPAYSRPRDGRPVTGSAVARTGRPPDRDGEVWYYYDPFYRSSYYYNRYPYGYYWPGYGYGVGYFYDPWMWGYPCGGYYGGGYYGSTYGRSDYRDVGGIRLKVDPEHAQVYVDGYYVGEVDNFDGIFQKLNLEAGAHRIEIRAEGYLSEQFEVMVIPGETITYKGDLKRQN
jgi:hypothetical protein